jgi:hypothetical protein
MLSTGAGQIELQPWSLVLADVIAYDRLVVSEALPFADEVVCLQDRNPRSARSHLARPH